MFATLLTAGCPTTSTNNGNPAPPPTPRLIVVGDEMLAKTIEREWQAGGRGKVEVQVLSTGELADMRRLPADGIVYPTAMIGDLAERRLITAMPDWAVTSEELNRTDILPLVRTTETAWGPDVFAVPLGSPQLAVLYRKDVLEAVGQPPPQTWREFNDLYIALTDAEETKKLPGADKADWQVVAQPLAKGWAAQVFLARAAPYARHPDRYSALFDYRTMEPLIDCPPFVRALEELARTASAASLDDTPASVRQKLLRGECALAVTWPTRTIHWPGDEQPLELPLGCFEMPGSVDVYNAETSQWEQRDAPQPVPLLSVDGYLASITTSARHTRSIAEALIWLSSPEVGKNLVGLNPHCTMYRTSQIENSPAWISRDFGRDVALEYGSTLKSATSRPMAVCSLRIPGRGEYMAALDNAVRAAVLGEDTPQVALSHAAVQWREITAKRGTEAQKSAYLRSLGLKP